MELRLNIVTLGVRDPQKAATFYGAGLGWPQSGASVDDFADPDGDPWKVAWNPFFVLREGRLQLPD